MATTYTTNLGMSKLVKGEEVGTWITQWNQDADRAEARLSATYAGDPNTHVAGSYVGQICVDTTNTTIYVCTSTGVAADAVWTAAVPDFYDLAPSGTLLLWEGSDASIPSGWTKVTSVEGKYLALTEVEGTLGNTVGSNSLTFNVGAGGAHDHGAVTGSHAITIAQMPVHYHKTGYVANTAGFYGADGTCTSAWREFSDGAAEGVEPISKTSTTGSGATHNHSISAASTHVHAITDMDNRPASVYYSLIKKD